MEFGSGFFVDVSQVYLDHLYRMKLVILTRLFMCFRVIHMNECIPAWDVTY